MYQNPQTRMNTAFAPYREVYRRCTGDVPRRTARSRRHHCLCIRRTVTDIWIRREYQPDISVHTGVFFFRLHKSFRESTVFLEKRISPVLVSYSKVHPAGISVDPSDIGGNVVRRALGYRHSVKESFVRDAGSFAGAVLQRHIVRVILVQSVLAAHSRGYATDI